MLPHLRLRLSYYFRNLPNNNAARKLSGTKHLTKDQIADEVERNTNQMRAIAQHLQHMFGYKTGKNGNAVYQILDDKNAPVISERHREKLVALFNARAIKNPLQKRAPHGINNQEIAEEIRLESPKMEVFINEEIYQWNRPAGSSNAKPIKMTFEEYLDDCIEDLDI